MSQNSKAISIDDTTDSFSFLHDADYTITFTDNKVMVKEAGGQNTNIATASFASVTDFDVSLLQNLSLNGVSFVEADVATDNKFDATGTNLDDLLKDLIQDRGVAGTMETLTVNGSKADAFKLVWDHLDDQYSYYNTPINETFIDLGIEYANYLLAGGQALTDTIVKFNVDGADLGTAPDRFQSLHDNILGNFAEAGISDKFGPGGGGSATAVEEQLDKIDVAGLSSLIGTHGIFSDGRPYYGGYEGESAVPSQIFDSGYFGI